MPHLLIIGAFVAGSTAGMVPLMSSSVSAPVAQPPAIEPAAVAVLDTQEETAQPQPAATTTAELPQEKPSLRWRTPSPELLSRTHYFALYYDVDPALALEIMRCESNYDPTIPGQYTPAHLGQDLGYLQVNTHYHGKEATRRGFDLNDEWEGLEYGMQLLAEGRPYAYWRASAYCWDPDGLLE